MLPKRFGRLYGPSQKDGLINLPIKAKNEDISYGKLLVYAKNIIDSVEIDINNDERIIRLIRLIDFKVIKPVVYKICNKYLRQGVLLVELDEMLDQNSRLNYNVNFNFIVLKNIEDVEGETYLTAVKKYKRLKNDQVNKLQCVLGGKEYNDKIQEIKIELISEIKKILNKTITENKYSLELFPREKKLQEALNFSKSEMDVILFCVYMIYLEKHDMMGNFYLDNMLHLKVLISNATKIEYKNIEKLFTTTFGVLKMRYLSLEAKCTLKIDKNIVNYLLGGIENFSNFNYSQVDKSYDINSFDVSKKEVNVIVNLLKSSNPSNILLYGEPGTGKTEFAKSVAVTTGKNVYFLNPETINNLEKSKIQLIRDLADDLSSEDILVLDDIDTVFNKSKGIDQFFMNEDKELVNNFFDNVKVHIIWIANVISMSDNSMLRRFTYNLKFDHFSEKQRLILWNEVLANYPMAQKKITKNKIKMLSEKYSINVAGISNAVQNYEYFITNNNVSNKKGFEFLEELLEKHAILTKNRIIKKNKNVNKVVPQYDKEALNLDVDIDLIISSVQNAYYQIKKNDKINMCMNLIFCGLPGTGKTEFAKYIANTIGVELIVKRPSDLFSKWVGDSEKNIKNMFEEAEKNNSILLLDECESVLSSRNGSAPTFELSRVNEFLTQMENFRGILICCTNHISMIDPAAIRRFHWKVKFNPINGESALNLYKKYFSMTDLYNEPFCQYIFLKI